MSLIKIISENEIQNMINNIAKNIVNDIKNNNETVFICILKGAFFFFSDLLKNINQNNIFIDFMEVKSYQGIKSNNKIILLKDISLNIYDKDVIIVEDIYDTGQSLYNIINYLNGRKPKSIKTCVLLIKNVERKYNIEINYKGFEIENEFIVGYGLDYNENFRNLPYIAKLVI